MTIIHFLPAFLLAASQTPAAPHPALPVHAGGRVAPAEDGALAFGWPGVYFEGRFRGTGVEVAVESGTEFMRVLVDGEEKALLRRPGSARLALRGLRAGEHVVRLEKQTESQTGGGRFIGFRALDGGVPLPPRPRERQIEFIGDSYTVGYGNTSPGRTCTEREVHDRTDTQRAFGPLLANRLNADYRIHAYSGFGIVRNYAGGRPGESLPVIYSRLVPDNPQKTEAAPGAWRPQLIVVNLGTNDFSTPLKAGEPWRTQEDLRRSYRTRYIAFARELMERQPQARLILMGSDAFIDEVRQVAAAIGKAGGREVRALRFGELENTGCNYHPSMKDHEALAALLEQALRGEADLWSRAPNAPALSPAP
jgi:lysophospholipase L1-like esterase